MVNSTDPGPPISTFSNELEYIGYGTFNATEFIAKCRETAGLNKGDILLGVIYVLMSVVGICKNIHVLYRMNLMRKEKLTTSKICFFILIGNLSLGDILILTLPIWVSILGLFNDRLILQTPGHPLTVATVFIHSCCARNTILLIMLIAIFRAVSIRSPLQSSLVISKVKAVALSCLSWILVVSLSIYTLIGDIKSIVFIRATALSMVRKDGIDDWSVTGQILTPFMLPGFITLLTLAYLLHFLIKMYRLKLSRLRSNSSSYRPEKEFNSVFMTIGLVIIFAVTYTPWYINAVKKILMNQNDQTGKYEATKWLCFKKLYFENLSMGGFLFLGSAINPFIYGKTLVNHPATQERSNNTLRTLNGIFSRSNIQVSLPRGRDEYTSMGPSRVSIFPAAKGNRRLILNEERRDSVC